MTAMTIQKEIRVGHLYCGIGGGAKGFKRGSARVGNMQAQFRNIGGIDILPAAIEAFDAIAGCKGTVLDLFSVEQYRAFHGRDPAPGWREATTSDIHRSFNHERPHIVFLSAPCKGFSGLLSEKISISPKYQALNGLTLRGIWLLLEAYKDDPIEFILFENVPRIATRGRKLLDQIEALLGHYGYAFAETTHDCGELGGLGQSRKRFLLVARHREKVPPFLYEPPKRPLRGVGEILEKLPMPGDLSMGPMHRIPSLQWKTWVRLAFVEAGSDWRSLNKLRVENGHLADYAIEPDTSWQAGVLGVHRWEDTSGVVAGRSSPTNGAFSVADPRHPDGAPQYQQYGVLDWEETAGSVINVKSPGQGTFAVADPRTGGSAATHTNKFSIVPWSEPSGAVIGTNRGPGSGAGCLADPRPSGDRDGAGKYRITSMHEPAGSVIAASTTGQGAFAVADPRPANDRRGGAFGVFSWDRHAGTVAGESLPPNGAFAVADPRPRCLNADDREGYMTQGHYGVLKWGQPSGAVPAFAKNNNGSWSVADPRNVSSLPAADDKLVCVIRALDNTWHRPFTTLELGALQSLVDPDEMFTLPGASDSTWREMIGNCVPPDAAQAIADVMGRTLLLAWAGEYFMLSADPIWVRPLTIALSVDVPEAQTS